MSLRRSAADFLGVIELVRFAAELANSPERWRDLARPDGDARVYEAIWSDERVNAWAIRWSLASDTGFHDHDDSAAGIVVIEGSVIEERLTMAGPPLARRFAAGQSFHISPSAIHRVHHAGGPAALTIHAYSPPLRHQGVYRIDPDGVLERDAIPYTEELRALHDLARP
jgi:predicted metal-dependent enzyme (double-stranded beta helix superfamily)